VGIAGRVGLKGLADDLSEPDRRFLEEGVRERGTAEVMSLFTEVFRQGGGGAILDYQLHGRPWGFSFEEVSVPVHLWHAEEDLVVPMHHAEDLASRLPDAKRSAGDAWPAGRRPYGYPVRPGRVAHRLPE
jgi:hypothetical protein